MGFHLNVLLVVSPDTLEVLYAIESICCLFKVRNVSPDCQKKKHHPNLKFNP